jgi:uncharacterized repeat protein (TIGR01451 family)
MERSRVVGVFAVSIAAALGVPGAAAAQAVSPLSVTIAARVCPTYDAISANRARNNIQESLEDLGADTSYPAGQPIDPVHEDASQPRCRPLPNWRFTLGTGIVTRAVTGPWGSLSIVTGPFATDIQTKESVALLNTSGQDTDRTIAGATTITLTPAQADLAARTSALWIQGGTPADPILNQPYPGQYGFGALRCAIDNLNGDNVEWISVPQGSRHVFCYAYYVQPPPTSGTIIVRKAVNAPAGAAAATFRFMGNISFAPDQSFTVSAAPNQPGAITFYRAGGSDWSFKEEVPVGWQLASLTCTAPGTSTSTIDPARAAATVHLVGGDVVTCTFTDDFHPPPAALTLAKVTTGAVGTFGFDVSGPSDGTATATTTAPDTQVTATPVFDDLPAGTYTITEQQPSSDVGDWALSAVRCNAQPLPVAGGARVSVDISPGQGTLCTFVNQFTPAGSIRLRKITLGATATVGFAITDASDQLQNRSYEQHATTTQQGVAVLAQGDDTSKIPLGAYDIRETTPSGTDGGGWRVESVLCNGIPVGSAQGRTRVTLTPENPDLDCTVTDRFVEDAAPGGGGSEPPPGIGVAGIKVVSPKTNLAVTKTATPTRIRTGDAVRYRVTVTNTSKTVTARSVTIAEAAPPSRLPVHVTTTKGSCTSTRPLMCSLGNLKPGQRVTLTATVRTRLVGRVVNHVAVSTATDELRLRDNVAHATVQVIPRPRFTG